MSDPKTPTETLRFIFRAESDADFDRRAETFAQNNGLSNVRREEHSPLHPWRSVLVRGDRDLSDAPEGYFEAGPPPRCYRCEREAVGDDWRDWISTMVEESDAETGPRSSDLVEVLYCLECSLATRRHPLVVRFRDVPLDREFWLVEDVSGPSFRMAWQKTGTHYARVSTGTTGCDFGLGQLVVLLPVLR